MSDIQKILNRITSKRRKTDAEELVRLIQKNIDTQPKIWDDKVIGWGDYHYVNKTSEGDMPILGLVPASAHITLYFTVGRLEKYAYFLEKLGQFKRGKICVYINNTDKIDKDIFEEFVKTYYQDVLSGKIVYQT